MLTRRLGCLSLAAVLVVSFGAAASAQTRPRDDAVQRRVTAAQAWDKGTAAYLADRYAQAADLFEFAYRMEPYPKALLQAIRAHREAGNKLRAANLALRLLDRYPEQRDMARYARRFVRVVQNRYVRVDVACVGAWLLVGPEQLVTSPERCTLEVDSVLHDENAAFTFFVTADTTHTVIAHFGTGVVSKTVSGKAGTRVELECRVPLDRQPEPV